jgi:hypothetical protein
LQAAAPAITWLAVGLPNVESLQVRAELGQQRQLRQRPVGDDQRAADALFLKVSRDELARAGAEVDRGREGKAGDGHGRLQMISK